MDVCENQLKRALFLSTSQALIFFSQALIMLYALSLELPSFLIKLNAQAPCKFSNIFLIPAFIYCLIIAR